MAKGTILWEEGWSFIEVVIRKLKKILAGESLMISGNEHIALYTMIYSMCTQKHPHDYSQQLYDNYKLVIDDYLESTVVPSLMEKQDDEFMLRELVNAWNNHNNVMVRRLSLFFSFVDRRYADRMGLPAVKVVGQTCFKDMVYERFKVKARQAVFALIEREREGEQIDRDLLKNVLDIYVRIRMDNLSCYVKDFEEPFLEESCRYYSAKASNWIMEDSCPDYMAKVEGCLRKEKESVSHYLHYSSEHKLLEKVEHVLLLAFNDKYTPGDQ